MKNWSLTRGSLKGHRWPEAIGLWDNIVIRHPRVRGRPRDNALWAAAFVNQLEFGRLRKVLSILSEPRNDLLSVYVGTSKIITLLPVPCCQLLNSAIKGVRPLMLYNKVQLVRVSLSVRCHDLTKRFCCYFFVFCYRKCRVAVQADKSMDVKYQHQTLNIFWICTCLIEVYVLQSTVCLRCWIGHMTHSFVFDKSFWKTVWV